MAKRKKAERNRDLCPGTEDPADRLFAEVAGILEQARRQTVRSVNTYMVTAYWLIGWRIVEAEQGGQTPSFSATNGDTSPLPRLILRTVSRTKQAAASLAVGAGRIFP